MRVNIYLHIVHILYTCSVYTRDGGTHRSCSGARKSKNKILHRLRYIILLVRVPRGIRVCRWNDRKRFYLERWGGGDSRIAAFARRRFRKHAWYTCNISVGVHALYAFIYKIIVHAYTAHLHTIRARDARRSWSIVFAFSRILCYIIKILYTTRRTARAVVLLVSDRWCGVDALYTFRWTYKRSIPTTYYYVYYDVICIYTTRFTTHETMGSNGFLPIYTLPIICKYG